MVGPGLVARENGPNSISEELDRRLTTGVREVGHELYRPVHSDTKF